MNNKGFIGWILLLVVVAGIGYFAYFIHTKYFSTPKAVEQNTPEAAQQASDDTTSQPSVDATSQASETSQTSSTDSTASRVGSAESGQTTRGMQIIKSLSH